MLGCSLENSQISRCYGRGAYFLTIYFQSVWCSSTLGSSSANPCSHVVRYVQSKSSFRSALLSIIAQCVGAAVSWQAAKSFWVLGLTPGHRQRLNFVHSSYCRSDLNVSVTAGALIESLACMINCVFSAISFSKNYQLVEEHVKMLLLCLITVAGKWAILFTQFLSSSNWVYY